MQAVKPGWRGLDGLALLEQSRERLGIVKQQAIIDHVSVVGSKLFQLRVRRYKTKCSALNCLAANQLPFVDEISSTIT